MPRSSHIAPNRAALHPFDLKYGTNTGGYLSPHELCSDAPDVRTVADAQNNGYSAVAPSVFREACRRWRESLPTPSRCSAYTFVDVGTGKGRPLLLATEQSFRKVIGVELNAELAGIARRNATTWKRATRSSASIRVVQQDAMEFRWPRPPLLVFLNNPFECAFVEQLVAKLAATAAQGPGLVDLVYVNPGCADTIKKQGSFRPLWDLQIEMDEADRVADPYGAIADRVAAYRFADI